MQTITTLDVLRNSVAAMREGGRALALVPTMGALHEGHLALVREAKKHADLVAVSIFVNPAQFGECEDLDAYPRQLAEDSALLEEEGVDLLWAPTVEEIYPTGYATNITVAGVSEGLCGANRPGHFDGVATVVCKLFNQVLPDIAVFGEKDWQQLAVIRRMARDLDLTRPFAGAIIGMPTVREADGLALSSRNRYLTATQRAQAAILPASIKAATLQLQAGEDTAPVLARLISALIEGGFTGVDYAQLADAVTLAPLTGLSAQPARLLVAARIGGTRLIDNMPVSKRWSGSGNQKERPNGCF